MAQRGLLGCLVLFAGCSGTTEDVRITLCKEMTLVQLNNPETVTWATASTTMDGYNDLIVELRYDATGRQGQAACFYRYNAKKENAWTASEPLSAYSASPRRMTLDGREILNPQLAEVIKDAMLKQGRELVDRAQRGIEQAKEEIQERLDGTP